MLEEKSEKQSADAILDNPDKSGIQYCDHCETPAMLSFVSPSCASASAALDAANVYPSPRSRSCWIELTPPDWAKVAALMRYASLAPA
jgi:hypothetical protein